MTSQNPLIGHKFDSKHEPSTGFRDSILQSTDKHIKKQISVILQK